MNECTKSSLRETITERLIERIEKSAQDFHPGLNRFEIELGNISPLDWLSRQSCPGKIYFSSRDKTFEIAALGTAKAITQENSKGLEDALEIIDGTLKTCDPAIKYLGGICFDYDEGLTDSWEAFGRYRFVVPQFEIRIENKKTIFAYNVELTEKQNTSSVIEDFKKAIDSINFDDVSLRHTDKYTIKSQVDSPGEKQWNENVTRIISDMKDRHIQKVVLARKSTLQTSIPVSPLEILRRLKHNNVMTYDFCFQFDDENAFVGCTPECLFSSRGKDIYSEAIAGTRLKGTDDAEQKKFHKELLESEKEQLEHDYVFDDINESLAGICSSVEVVNRRQVVSLAYLQHFCSKFNGQLKDGVSISDIIGTLHPTAAVNGYPPAAARQEIRKYETFSRGWFAGPVGWIAKDSAHFAVAIRSALIQNDNVSLFAGAGIVESSNAASEWQETANKIQQFLEVIK